MRYILACAAIASLYLATGCDDRRQNMAVVPDREGHAYYAEGGTPPIGNKPQAGEGEQYHTLQPGETLASVARKYNIDLGWLIKRNDIQDESKVKPGMQLIVPRIQMATAMPQQPVQQQPQPAQRPLAPQPKPAPVAPKKKH